MKRRRYVIGILLCVTALLQAQDSVKPFDEFFVAGMDKIDGVFPVYVAEKPLNCVVDGCMKMLENL